MSHYSEVKSIMKNQKCLIKALQRMGFKREEIQVSDEAQNLRGFQGDTRKQKAHIRIKGAGWGNRENAVGGASNDLGWEKQADGTYKFHVSEYDQRSYGKQWQENLQAYYEEEVVRDHARMNGYTVTDYKQKNNGEIHLTVNTY